MRRYIKEHAKIEKKLNIESYVDWVVEKYRGGLSCPEIREYLVETCGEVPTIRSIQRVVQRHLWKKYCEVPRSAKEAFNDAIKKGRVKWKYKNAKVKRYQLNKQRRLEVFIRDQSRCVICGSTAKEAVLEIDHIIPLCKGGNSDMDNLRVLCYECNVGKRMLEKEV